MRAKIVLRTKAVRSKSQENIVDFYQESYRKYRHWLWVYYFTILVIGLSIQFNNEDWKLFFEYRKIKSINAAFDRMFDVFPELAKDWYKNIKPTVGNIRSKIFMRNMRYQGFAHPFVYEDKDEGRYFSQKRQGLVKLSEQYYSCVLPEVSDYLVQDSLITRNLIEEFRLEYEQRRSEGNNIAGRLQKKLVDTVNGKIDSLINVYLSANLYERFFADIEGEVFTDKKLSGQNFFDVVEDYRGYNKRLDELGEKPVGTLPYVDMQITVMTVLILMSLFFIVMPHYLLLLYSNYQDYEKVIKRRNGIYYRVPTTKNILERFEFDNNFSRQLFGVVTLLVVVVIPFGVSIIDIYLLLSFSWVFSFLYLISGFFFWVLFLRSKRGLRLIDYIIHFR